VEGIIMKMMENQIKRRTGEGEGGSNKRHFGNSE
jgi:hypothetical protein